MAEMRHWLWAGLGALTLGGVAHAQALTDASLSWTTIIGYGGGLTQPTTMAFVAPGEFLVTEKVGRVRRVQNGVLDPTPVLTFNVNTESERGVLGIAVNKSTPPSVFVYVTEAPTPEAAPIANRIYRYTWNSVAKTLTGQTLVLDLPVLAGPNHNGGVFALGTPGQFSGVGDGAPLFVVIGDLNHYGRLQNIPTDPPDDTGVILRVLQNGAPAPGNPFTPYCSVTTTQTCSVDANCPGGQTCLTRVARYWGYGIRNSFGLAIDPVTGALWDTENGPNSMDEVNRVGAGFNSGWIPIMGPDSLDPENVGDLVNMPGAGVTYSDPEFSWGQTVAPTAILFPVGSSLGATYDQRALVSDANLGIIYSFPLNVARTGFVLTGGLTDLVAEFYGDTTSVQLGTGFGSVTDLEIGPDGHLYVVDIIGRILRVTGTRDNDVPALPGAFGGALAAALLLGLSLGLVQLQVRRRRPAGSATRGAIR